MKTFLSLWHGEVTVFDALPSRRRPDEPRPFAVYPVSKAILAQTAEEHGITVGELRSGIGGGRSKHPRVVARYDAMSRLYRERRWDGRNKFSLPQIAGIMGMKDHTSVIHGLRRWDEIERARREEAVRP